ncbi:hypothetical protein DVA67_033340 [Solirubrobacter sp. CPCC 204708]|uniref:Uncharacterized protein n=1 Tax=Solirubrobacter deserti TaxID=2282478 RepID=A0ABT4RIZ8_9ACTN|nr:hypothetical protein [Solirubrobacter deserti]MBE2320890.1 hypothetical protein [Solirubrobacter deserti]MDA0138525.1 hypothetical protein [Solirubrobacter deserti]
MQRMWVIVLVLAGFAVLAAPASARVIDVPDALNPALGDARDAGIVVLFPSRVNLDIDGDTEVFAEGEGNRRQGTYSLSLSGAEDCGGANACFLAEFSGRKGAPLGYRSTNVSLALGLKGYYQKESCGGSCSPPSISWVQKGVRYELQAKALGGRSAFVKMANSAIRAGNRR